MKLYDQVQSGALDRVNARLKNIKFQTTAGPHKIGVTFRRQSFAESDDQLQMFAPGGGQDRSLPRELVPASGPLRCERPQFDAQPRSHLHLQPGKGSKARRPKPAPRRFSRRSRSALIAVRCPNDDVDGAHAVLRRWREGRRFRVRHSRAPSPECWRARSSCIAASASPRG